MKSEPMNSPLGNERCLNLLLHASINFPSCMNAAWSGASRVRSTTTL
ncbi:MAG: hypothetical protein GF329_19140 [Candidatus Lokiarchaeota archaeon]|nr:hypothetical protein [Candidatus Lokiarchaeota archaeon]